MAGKRKLKMTKKCIAARRCYRARKAGVPARRKRKKKGSGFTGFHGAFGNPTKRGHASGGDFWGDVGNFFTHTLPETVVSVAPMLLAAL